MNFFADESVEGQIVDGLRKAGYSVLYVAEMSPAIDDDAVLITADKDLVNWSFGRSESTTV